MTRPDGLTPQQGRVAELVAAGETDKTIAATLHISEDGVTFHIARICKAWSLDASKNLRAQITRRFVEITQRKPAA